MGIDVIVMIEQLGDGSVAVKADGLDTLTIFDPKTKTDIEIPPFQIEEGVRYFVGDQADD